MPAEFEMEHEESPYCWCCPEVVYVDLLSDHCIYVHNSKEDAN